MAKYKLTFSKDEIKSTVDKIKTKDGKIKYLTYLSDEFRKMFYNKNGKETLKLINEHKIQAEFIESKESIKNILIIEKFKYWLNEDIWTHVGKLKLFIDNNIDISSFESEQSKLIKKYPTHKFNVDKILYSCNHDYPEYDEKIAYLEYVIAKFKKNIGNNSDWIYEETEFQNFIPNIEREIEKLKKECILIDKLNIKSVNNPQKSLNKFKWQGTEKSILILIELLFNSGFFIAEDYKKCSAILRDSFLNKEGKPFNNSQLRVTRNKTDKIEESGLINSDSEDYSKFMKMLANFKKIIED